MQENYAISNFQILNSPEIWKKRDKRTYARIILRHGAYYWVLIKFIGAPCRPAWVLANSFYEHYEWLKDDTRDTQKVKEDQSWLQMWWPNSLPGKKAFPHLFVGGNVHMRIDWGHQLKIFCDVEHDVDPIEENAVMTFQPLTCNKCVQTQRDTDRWNQKNDLLDMIAGDENDGVYWGMAFELGIDPE